MNEEIQFKFGANAKPLMGDLRGIKSMVSNAFSGFGASIAGAFTVGAAVDQFNKLRDAVEQIRRVSESTGLDTGLVQDLMNVAKAAGISGDAVEAALDVFVKNLGPGSDPEEALFRLTLQLSHTADVSEAAKIAVENFGKAGVKLLPILQQGVAGLRETADQYGRIGESQLQMIEHADDLLDRLAISSKVWFASIIEGFNILSEIISRIAKNGFFSKENTGIAPKVIEEFDQRFNDARNRAEKEAAQRRAAGKAVRDKEEQDRQNKIETQNTEFERKQNLRQAVHDQQVEEAKQKALANKISPEAQLKSGAFDADMQALLAARNDVTNKFQAGDVLGMEAARNKVATLQAVIAGRMQATAQQEMTNQKVAQSIITYVTAAMEGKGIKIQLPEPP